MGRKDKKGKDDDVSDGDAILGALGLAVPDIGSTGAARPAPAPAPAPQGSMDLSFDIGAAVPAPKPAMAPRPAPVAAPVARDSLMLSFGEPSPAPAPVARPAVAAPAPAPVAARPAIAAPAPAPVQAAPKPAPARRLASLPALPQFVSPDQIKIEMGFDSPPVEGKGKIKEIVWNLKATDQASNVITRQSRVLNLSPLMAEALDQAKSLRDTIKLHKEPTSQPRAAPAPAPRPAPAVVAQPAPRPAPAPVAARPAVAAPASAPQPRPAPKPAVAQPAPRPAPKPAPRMGPVPSPVSEPLPDLEPIVEQQPLARARPQIQLEPDAGKVPERDIIAVPVKTMGGDVLQAQQPIERHAWAEAKSVMAPSATSKFTAVAQQNFQESPAPVAAHPQPRAAPARQAPAPEPAQEEVQTAAQARGGRICSKCGGSNFREDDDKNRPLSFTPPFLYAKKFTCKNCGTVLGAEAQEAAAPAAMQAPRPTRPSQVAQQQAAPVQARRVVQTSWEETTQQVRPSAVAAKEEAAPDYGSAGYEEAAKEGVRAVCPSCGGTSFNVVQDKTRPISFGMGGIGATYAKVKQCRKCGAKFD